MSVIFGTWSLVKGDLERIGAQRAPTAFRVSGYGSSELMNVLERRIKLTHIRILRIQDYFSERMTIYVGVPPNSVTIET